MSTAWAFVDIGIRLTNVVKHWD